MQSRLLAAIIGSAVVMAGLLLLRQQRLADMHQMAELHAAMDQDRKALWDLQVRIAEHSRPVAIEEAVDRAGIRLEPISDRSSPATQPADHRVAANQR